MHDNGLIVLKFGGSVLTDTDGVRAAAAEVARFVSHGWRVVAVVSALNGETDRLITSIDAFTDVPCPFAKSLLVSTGELSSAALLALAIRAHSIDAEVLDSAAAGLLTQGPPLDATPISLDVNAILFALGSTPVIILPGFVGRDARRRVTLLGRGGSDFTALFVARELGARCRLVKDVDGLYEHDPNVDRDDARPRRFSTLHWRDALRLDGRIVQHKAVRWAEEHGVEFEVGAIGQDDATIVGAFEKCFTQSTSREARRASHRRELAERLPQILGDRGS